MRRSGARIQAIRSPDQMVLLRDPTIIAPRMRGPGAGGSRRSRSRMISSAMTVTPDLAARAATCARVRESIWAPVGL